MKLDEAVQEQLAAMVADEGLNLLATEFVGSGPKMILRLVVEGSNGVGLDQCALISRQASALLDVEDPVGHHYTLEVSSPGLDRRLYSHEDFARYAGQRVKIRMVPSYREYRTVIGELLGSTGEEIRVCDDAGTEIQLPAEEIFEARLEVDWDAIMKEGKSRP